MIINEKNLFKLTFQSIKDDYTEKNKINFNKLEKGKDFLSGKILFEVSKRHGTTLIFGLPSGEGLIYHSKAIENDGVYEIKEGVFSTKNFTILKDELLNGKYSLKYLQNKYYSVFFSGRSVETTDLVLSTLLFFHTNKGYRKITSKRTMFMLILKEFLYSGNKGIEVEHIKVENFIRNEIELKNIDFNFPYIYIDLVHIVASFYIENIKYICENNIDLSSILSVADDFLRNECDYNESLGYEVNN